MQQGSITQTPVIITRELQSSRIATDFKVNKRQLILIELHFYKRNNKTPKETARITHTVLYSVFLSYRWGFRTTGRERLIRSHSSAGFCFELSGNSN